MIEALVTVFQDHVQEQLQIGIELDVSHVGNTTILQRLPNNTGKQRSRTNQTDVQYG